MQIENRLKDLIQSIDKRGLFLFKGFNNEFAVDFNKLPYKKIIDIDIANSINNNVDLNVSDLMVKFSSLYSDNNKYILDYETFLLIDKNIINIMHGFGFPIYIINNNLFFRYYPCVNGLNKNVIEAIDNNSSDKIINKIYSEYGYVNNIISVLYSELNIDFDIPQYNLFEEKQRIRTVDYLNKDVFTFTYDESVLCSNILEIVKTGNEKEKLCYLDQCPDMIVEKLEYLSCLGYNIFKIDKKIEIIDTDYSEYEKILKRRNPDYCFRKLSIYNEPGFSVKQIEISQGQIIKTIIDNVQKSQVSERIAYNDVFVTAPTGAGKSIMFQIPAIYIAENYDLLTIVVTPLIGLMNDQVDKIIDLTDCAATINSDYTPAEKETVLNQIKSGEKSILYISPETLLSNGDITSLIGDRKIGLMIIDEAHTVATWGKSFRPDYWYLGDYIHYLRTKKDYSFPIATFSATITYGGSDDMYYDVVESLKMRPIESTTFIGSVRRDDISFDINSYESKMDYISEKEKKVINSLIDLNQKDKKVISYFPFKRHIEDIRKKLPININASRYYSTIDKIEKNDTINDFKSGKSKLVLATKAFGMGIDIDDVDVVYHYAPTGNLCDYVQEIGRAARKNDIRGIAKVDFYKDDFKFINQLHGMSRIRNSQIIEVLNKIKNIYYVRNSRNFTVSPDEFSYIFSNSNADSVDISLKTALLMIQKDFERDTTINYKPLIFKPRSLFTEGYFLIQDDDLDRFKNGLTVKYSELYAEKDDLKTYGNRNSVSYYNGKVYVVDFKTMWEENYKDMSFPQFKRAFFLGELQACEDTSKYIPKYLVTINSDESFSEINKKCKIIVDALKEIFNEIIAQNKHFSITELSEELYKKCEVFLTANSAKIASNNIITIINNISKNSFNSGHPIDYNKSTDKYSIKSKAAIDKSISMFNKELYNTFNQSWESDKKTFLVDLKKNKSNNDIVLNKKVLVAQFLESFGLAKYDVRSGERPEFFIRVNSIKAIERILENPYYKSSMVELVNDRHNDSVEKMNYFFKELKNDKERWDDIEQYFVASDSIN